MQGTEGRWRQSRRRSKHEVQPPFFANLKTQSNSRYDSKSDFIGNFNCFYGSVLVICLHLNLGFWQWWARFPLLCLHLYLHLLSRWCCPLCCRCKYSSVSEILNFKLIKFSRHSIEYSDFLGKNYEAMVLLTIVLGGTIILTSILGVVSIYKNTKGLIWGFQLVLLFLMLTQAVLSIQGIIHVTSYKVKLAGENLFYDF